MKFRYESQVRLLLQILPFLSKAEEFALKGGTAINFIIRDLPRLSVDIDLTYLPVKGRKESLKEITQGMQRIADEIKQHLAHLRVSSQTGGGTLSKLFIQDGDAQVKLEVNTVLRGAIFGPEHMELSSRLQQDYEMFVSVQTLRFEDLYGGKLCAALDRQHPRDLFDVRLLLSNEGITDGVRKAFLGYLISHSRPISELLHPNVKPIDRLYSQEFAGMSREGDLLEELKELQSSLAGRILQDLTPDEKEFLMSFKRGTPEWDLMGLPMLKELPAVKWKLLNISRMDRQKHDQAIEKLEQVLSNS
jgi:predicted nucleotidyltransferase component of viral defense system